ncbi:unnamed protein product [Trifolium pratense]|uniref:Uncharacterized protein n=1 Tax=Trifolium pratense TaxID=57577 RepID=A0ACB0L4X3_TRIPR|nr:unnamed protein product [Trifolium pratense]
MNKNGAPGPDGFGAFFYQTYWDIIKDVCNAVLEFFTFNWILPNFNSNTVVLIPKVSDADTIGQFRPIAMANFKFKIISKILADRLALVLPDLISKEQRGFVQGRQIKDCILLTSEAINMLHHKSYGGNLAIKIDIAKAFDTIDWSFLIKVSKVFGFNSIFCNWISTILHSARLSISINGKNEGYFECARGVRQGDPLSPLLFCLAEEVLSRGLTKLVNDGHLKLIKGTRSSHIPSHILYANDVMLFCKGTSVNINVLTEFFAKYAQISGQYVNPLKSTIFAGSMSQSRVNNIAYSLGFSIGLLPFIYLGVPIFKGKAKTCHFAPIFDKIKLKLAKWKASLLSYAGRVQLLKSVIQSMLIYSITIYSWPVSVIKDLEKLMRNFLWSGDMNARKLVTVPWHIVCSTLDEGGLGVRSLSSLNQASNLKLIWDLMNSNILWASFLRSRVVRNKNFISQLNYPVSDFIFDHQWHIPMDIQTAFPQLLSYLQQFFIPFEDKEDFLIWNHTTSGELTMKDAYHFFSNPGPTASWSKTIWNIAIPPSKSFLVWRLFHHKMPTDDALSARGFYLTSVCSLCKKQSESSLHLFLQCPFALSNWHWLASLINQRLDLSSYTSILNITSAGWNPHCRITITAAVINIFNSIWQSRNNLWFKNIKSNLTSIISQIIASVSLTGNCSTLSSNSSITNFSILKFFKINIHHVRPPKIIEVLWQPPMFGWYKCNTDGASLGNPGIAACTGIFRNHRGEMVSCFSKHLGLANALFAEAMGVILAIEHAYAQNWSHLWIESDSKLVSLAFKSPNIIHWKLKNRWMNCIYMTRNMSFIISHIYREGNHCADKLANLGLSLQGFTWWTSAPVEIREDLTRNRLGFPYFRCC